VLIQHVLEIAQLLDRPVRGETVADHLRQRGLEVMLDTVEEPSGTTDFLRMTVAGAEGRTSGGTAPTTGVVGRLGGVGARPDVVGMVSDADGAIAALALACKVASMTEQGDQLAGDMIIGTHVCAHAPTQPHEPVPFMGSPVDMATMNRFEVSGEMDLVLSIDATKGNRLLNHRGIAITPTLKRGWILPTAPDLLDLLEWVTGEPARVLPLSMYDVTPYGNELYHVNSIVQPAVATDAPVVGVATTAAVPVPGTASGANHAADVALAATFALEVAKAFGAGRCRVFDEDEYRRAQARYGSMARLQTMGDVPDQE
jgi:hypothetical protein